MYRYIYKITLTEGSLKNKIYYGQHSTNNLKDGYKGSGSILLKYYKKHPNGYQKEIIAFYATKEELNQAEYNLIKPHLNKDYCINQRDGGNQGTISDVQKKIISESAKKRIGNLNPFYGKKHTSESKELMSINNAMKKEETKNKSVQGLKEKYKNDKEFYTNALKKINKMADSRRGKICVNKDNHNKYICTSELDFYLSQGYSKGGARGKNKR